MRHFKINSPHACYVQEKDKYKVRTKVQPYKSDVETYWHKYIQEEQETKKKKKRKERNNNAEFHQKSGDCSAPVGGH